MRRQPQMRARSRLLAARRAVGQVALPLSRLGRKHVNMLGRYSFTAPPPGGLRPLRDPSTPDHDQDERHGHR
jgi:hypothetical protein